MEQECARALIDRTWLHRKRVASVRAVCGASRAHVYYASSSWTMIRKCVWNASTNRPLRFPRPVRTGNDAQLTMQQEIVREIFLSERFTFYGRSNGHVRREDNWGLTSRVKTSGSIFLFLFDSPFSFFIFKIYIYIIERFLVYFWSSASNIHRRFRSTIWKIFQRWINRLFFFFENKFENKIERCWEELRCAQSKRNLLSVYLIW